MMRAAVAATLVAATLVHSDKGDLSHTLPTTDIVADSRRLSGVKDLDKLKQDLEAFKHSKANNINIGLLGPFDHAVGWKGMTRLLPTIAAFIEINNSTDLCPEHGFSFILKESQVNANLGFFAGLEFSGINWGPDAEVTPAVEATLGGPYGEISNAVCSVGDFYARPHLSTAASTYLNENDFFNRLFGNADTLGEAMAVLASSFGFNKVMIVQTNTAYTISITGAIRKLAPEIGMEVIQTETFQRHTKAKDLDTLVKSLKTGNSHVIFLSLHQGDALQFLEQAAVHGMVGYPYTYIGTNTWGLTSNDMLNNYPGTMFLQPFAPKEGVNEIADHFNTMYIQDFVDTGISQGQGIGGQSIYAYDAGYIYARAFDFALTAETKCPDSSTSAADREKYKCNLFDATAVAKRRGTLVQEYMRFDMDFVGASGRVQYQANGERKNPSWSVYTGIKGESRCRSIGFTVGHDFVLMDEYKADSNGKYLWWPEGTPFDWYTKQIIEEWETVGAGSEAIAISCFVTSCLVALLAVGFTFINKDQTIFKMMQYRICALVVVGLLIFQMASIFYARDSQSHPDFTQEQLDSNCVQERVFVVIGLSLALSVLVAKVWRVHAIFQSAVKFKSKVITDISLLMYATPFVVIMTILTICWVSIFPPTFTVETGPEIHLEYETYSVTKRGRCTTEADMDYLEYVIVLIFGVVLVVASALSLSAQKLCNVEGINDMARISYILMLKTFILFVMLVIGIFVDEPVGRFVIFTTTSMTLTLSSIGLLYGKPIHAFVTGKADKMTSRRRSSALRTHNTTNDTKTTISSDNEIGRLKKQIKDLEALVQKLQN